VIVVTYFARTQMSKRVMVRVNDTATEEEITEILDHIEPEWPRETATFIATQHRYTDQGVRID
jgi:hypothetical protein